MPIYNQAMVRSSNTRRIADKPNPSQKSSAWFEALNIIHSLLCINITLKSKKINQPNSDNTISTPGYANEIGKILYPYSDIDNMDALPDILDMVSSRGNSPEIFGEFAHFIGHILVCRRGCWC